MKLFVYIVDKGITIMTVGGEKQFTNASAQDIKARMNEEQRLRKEYKL